MKEPNTRKSVTLPDSMWSEIANYRYGERIATEAEAVRRLLQEALDAEFGRPMKRKGGSPMPSDNQPLSPACEACPNGTCFPKPCKLYVAHMTAETRRR